MFRIIFFFLPERYRIRKKDFLSLSKNLYFILVVDQRDQRTIFNTNLIIFNMDYYTDIYHESFPSNF